MEPPASLTFTAIAVAGRRANAVGAVRIDLDPQTIAVELRRVATFADGFAPGSFAEPVQIHAPYTAVRALVREGGLLYLGFDPARVTPHNRFALTAFSEGGAPRELGARALRSRARAHLLGRTLPLPGGIVAAAVGAWLAAGSAEGAGQAAIGLLVGLVTWALARELATQALSGGPLAERARDRFERELASRLALVSMPAVVRLPPPVVAARLPPRRRVARTQPVESRAPAEALPAQTEPARGFTAASMRRLAAVVLVAVGVAGSMAFLAAHATPRDLGTGASLARAGLAALVRRASPAPPPVVPEGERCLCVRADSPLWKSGMPRVAVLTFHGEEELSGPVTSAPDARGKHRFDFDLAIVNDGARPVRDVRFVLVFARRNAAGKRAGVTDRGLFWEGELAPGASVKWRVKAPGTEVRIDGSENGTLEEASLAPGPPDMFWKLMSSHYRAVRVHAATMLAYLRDPRADAALRTLKGRGVDATIVEQLRRAGAPVIACDVKRSAGHADACVFNASSRRKQKLSVRPAGSTADGAPLGVTLPVHEGRKVSVDLEGEAEIELLDGELE